ncbi:N-acetylated-alpha-linked acidic dipeptidase 2-like isoform X2 [Anneissia japonica]|uniref:N-acetylated-alpha-linked acidic dipeptidase 2-like isoform X2 n=1 Tax=Anneissia japonica TaxID=1529436 RepID=UPI001425A029|nr:N-acetylated-alpha-linked acidic dipeptidase 2-like isoform X2 [Anneissia japonica]
MRYGIMMETIDVNDVDAKGDGKRIVNRNFIVFILCMCILSIGLGLLIGYFTFPKTLRSPSNSPVEEQTDHEWVSETLMNHIDVAKIEDNLRYFASQPHLAGTPAEKENSEYIRRTWIEQGLDSAKLVPYDVYLSYPDKGNPNKVSVLENGQEIFSTREHEDILRPEDDHPNVVPPFNAYSAQGTVEGNLVYVNYATADDFEYLERQHHDINITGKIVIARYGRIFRGSKVQFAEAAGAIGVIFYSDPKDYASDDAMGAYPNAWWLPGSGAQRGTVLVGDGDPLTSGYPAKEYAYRLSDENANLPRIPVHPIGYEDAEKLLMELGGEEVPEKWRGSLNITYTFGPTFKNPNRTIRMKVMSKKEIRTVYNVVGMIKGRVEPDRYVILGNHRDAWVYGAVDPSSGTAAFMEVTRAFGKLLKTGGWRPRRSIIFCSWAAEEYGLIGSTEYVEDFQRVLGERSVIYINVDSAVTGNYTMRAKATPSLKRALFAAAKKVPSPDDGFSSTFELWLKRFEDTNDPTVPHILSLGSGSDFAPFVYSIGVPATDFRWTYNPHLGLSSYPVYHSVYETFYLVKTFLDWDFKRHQAVARVWTELARNFADSIILPFDCIDYANKIRSAINSIRTSYEDNMNDHGITFDAVISAINNLTTAATTFHANVQEMDVSNVLAVRRINDQLMLFERAFIDPLGLPGRNHLKHIVFAPSSKNVYAGDAFPGLVDSLYRIDEDINNQEQRWNAVREQLALTAFIIQSSASTLKDVDDY